MNLGKVLTTYLCKGTKTRANDKINSYLFLLCRVQSPYVKVEKKSDSQKKNRFFLRYATKGCYENEKYKRQLEQQKNCKQGIQTIEG